MLNSTKIKNIKAISKIQEITDYDGLILRVSQKGTKTFVFRYNHPISKKSTRITIGNIEHFTLKEAR